MYTQSLWKQKEDTRSPGAGVTISCKPPGAQQQAFLTHDCLSRPSIGILSGLDGLLRYFTLNSHKRFLFPHNFLWLGWLKGLTIPLPEVVSDLPETFTGLQADMWWPIFEWVKSHSFYAVSTVFYAWGYRREEKRLLLPSKTWPSVWERRLIHSIQRGEKTLEIGRLFGGGLWRWSISERQNINKSL